jgi:5-methylthioadenosine/S-adenosylhomocysteine deaminase
VRREAQGVRRASTLLALVGAGLVFLAAAKPAPRPAAKASADLLVFNARVVTMDDAQSVVSPGAIAVSAGKIVAVGPSARIAREHPARETFDARGAIVLPGLVNTHTHAAMDLLRGIADDLPLDRWLHEDIFPAEAKNVSPEFVYDGTLLAALEMIRGGTTTFADMYYFESEAARAVDRAGLRGVLGETFIDFPVPDHKDLAATVAYMETFASRWAGHPRIVPAAAPHAPYTCSKETLLAARDFALRHSLPLLIHVAETRKELEDARSAWKKTPFARLAEVGFFDPSPSGARVPIVAAHAVWMEEGDRELVRRYGVALSHNPESNMKLASGIADVPAWLRDGIVWGLGTDGTAGSNNDLSMFEAMDFAGKLAKVAAADPTVLPAAVLVRAATRGGAEALGLGDRIGSLAPGKRADFIVVGTRNPHVEPAEDVYSTLVYSAKASDVTDVWVEGRRLLAAGRPTTLDEPAILEAARRWRARIRASLAPPAAKEAR